MGGVFNNINLHLYHYAGNNPVKYIDPDGRQITIPSEGFSIPAHQKTEKKTSPINGWTLLSMVMTSLTGSPPNGMSGSNPALAKEGVKALIVIGSIALGTIIEGVIELGNTLLMAKVGENGTKTSSTTTGKNGKTERVDVENPNPSL